MKPKPDWKQKYEELRKSESKQVCTAHQRELDDARIKCRDLRIERDAAERRYQEMVVKAEMPGRIVEFTPKTETTYGLPWLFWVFFVIWLTSALWMNNELKKFETPILSPYAVYITKHENQSSEIYDELSKGLDECHNAWRADERTIRKLERHIQQEAK
jgi:hypothetical protein